jgi:hypothetical protein
MTEKGESVQIPPSTVIVHVEGEYEYQSLEIARQAAEVACHAAAKLRPSRTKSIDDDDWTEHPDRSD